MTHTARILIVDDEAPILHVLKRLLKREGYAIEVALSGEEALEKLATFAPDLVLADYRMPGMYGTELLEKVRDMAPGAVRVLLAATGPSTLFTPSSDSGERAVEYFIAKPWTDAVLLQQLQDWLAQAASKEPGAQEG